MIFTFEREPWGWVHPCYSRRRCHQVDDWDAFVRPALASVGTLNHLLNLANQDTTSISRAKAEKTPTSDKFELKLDVQQFKPEELDVKMVDNCLVVEGKHEEKQDEHGFVSRQFVRRYQLPDDVKPESVTCNLGSDGVLRVSAPRMIEQKPASERTIPINLTGKSAATEKEEKSDEKQTVTEKHEKMEEVPSTEANAA